MSYLIDPRTASDYQNSIDLSFSSSVIDPTIQEYDATEITYTCPTYASTIIYELTFTMSWSPDSLNYSCSRLQESTNNGATWTTIAGTKAFEGSGGSGNKQDWLIINHIYFIDPYAGTKKFRVAGRAYSSTTEFTLGDQKQTLSSSTSLPGSSPIVSMYAIRG